MIKTLINGDTNPRWSTAKWLTDPNPFYCLTFQQYFLRPADQNETEMQAVMKNLRSKIDAVLDRMTGVSKCSWLGRESYYGYTYGLCLAFNFKAEFLLTWKRKEIH